MGRHKLSPGAVLPFEKQGRTCSNALKGTYVALRLNSNPHDFYPLKMIVASFRDRPSPSSASRQNNASDTDTDTDAEDDDEIVDQAYGWAYVGSHNFTPSAWGNLSGSGFNPSLNVSLLLHCDSWSH
jgi:hypothetical protein